MWQNPFLKDIVKSRSYLFGGIMVSKARVRFDEQFADVYTLIQLHDNLLVRIKKIEDTINDYENIGRALRKPNKEIDENISDGIDVLNRSAIVLMVSLWEAYIEDICSEALAHIVKNVRNPVKLPKEIKKQVAKEIKEEKNEIQMWLLAEDGWRKYVQERLIKYKEIRDKNFTSPKSTPTEIFIYNVLGLENITSKWDFKEINLTPKKCIEKLDKLVVTRGEIAHRGVVKETITKDWLLDNVKFLQKIVGRTGGEINTHIKKITGEPLFSKK